MTAATEPVGVSKVFPRPPMETLSKDRYFVSGSGIALNNYLTFSKYDVYIAYLPLAHIFELCSECTMAMVG